MRTHAHPSSGLALPGYSPGRNSYETPDISNVIESLRERYLVIFRGDEPSELFLRTIAEVLVGIREKIIFPSDRIAHAVRIYVMTLLGDYFEDKPINARGNTRLIYHAYPENDLERVFGAIRSMPVSPKIQNAIKTEPKSKGEPLMHVIMQETVIDDFFIPTRRLPTAEEGQKIRNVVLRQAANDPVLMQAFKGIL